MNSFTSSPRAAILLAGQIVDERVREAQDRARRRAARADRTRPLTSAPPPHQARLPWWAFRYVRPA